MWRKYSRAATGKGAPAVPVAQKSAQESVAKEGKGGSNLSLRLLWLGVVGVLLGGCATPAELMKRTPDVEYLTVKDPRTVLGCISSKFTEHNCKTNTIFTEKGYILYMVKNIDYAYLAVGVEPEGRGSRVRLAKNPVDTFGTVWDEWVLGCK